MVSKQQQIPSHSCYSVKNTGTRTAQTSTADKSIPTDEEGKSASVRTFFLYAYSEHNIFVLLTIY